MKNHPPYLSVLLDFEWIELDFEWIEKPRAGVEPTYADLQSAT